MMEERFQRQTSLEREVDGEVKMNIVIHYIEFSNMCIAKVKKINRLPHCKAYGHTLGASLSNDVPK